MKVNTKIRYGLRTMIELAMNAGEQGLFQKDIAVRQGIPIKYLDKIISELKSADLVLNVGGKSSGYILAREAKKISVYDIYKAFEGKLSIIQCVNSSDVCCRNEKCASHEFWNGLNTEMEAIMISKSLDRLVKRQVDLLKHKEDLMNFQI